MEPFFLLRSSDDEDYQEDGRWDSVSLGSSHRRSGGFSYLKATLSSSAKQRQARHAQCRFASMPIPPKQQKDVALSAATLHQGVSGKTYGSTAKNVNTLTSRKFQTNPRVSSSDIASKWATISTGILCTRIRTWWKNGDKKEKFTGPLLKNKEEVLELERKLKCKKEELQNLMGNESENMHQRKMLEDKLKSQDPGQSDGEGYKLEDRFKIEGISSHNISAAGLKSCHMKVGISKRAVMNDQGGEVDMRNQEEMIKEGKDIEKPGDMDQWFGLHKWTITGDHVSQLTAAFTFQTRYGEKLTELPKSGLVRRAQNNHKTERQRLQSHVDIIVRAIVEQLWKADFYLDENSSDDAEDDKMSENKLEVTKSSDYDQNTIKIDDPDICDANPEAVVEQLLCFDNKLNEFSEIKHDSSSEEILAQLIANQKLLITRKLAKCHIERKICQVAEFRRLDQYNIFLQNLVDSCPYISLHEDIEETYKRLKSDNKLYGLPDCMVYVGLQYFRDLLHYLENPYDSRLREAHRADLLDIINMECKIKRRSKMQFRKLINYGYPVYDEFRKRLIMRDYAEVYDSARSMISLHRKFDYHLASFSFIKFDIFREENFKDKRLIPEEYSILPRNLIVQSINFWYVMLEKKHELRRCTELVKYLLSECAKSFDEEQFLSDSKKFSDLPKHIILRGILIRKRILECTGTSKIKLWERTRYYEDQIYEVPLRLAEKDLNALNLDVPIWDIFFKKPLPKNGVILMKRSEDRKVTVDVKVVPEETIFS